MKHNFSKLISNDGDLNFNIVDFFTFDFLEFEAATVNYSLLLY